MEKQIVIAIDDSSVSTHALDYVAHLFAQDTSTRFHLVHCQIGDSGCLPIPEDSDNSLMPESPLSKSRVKSSKCLNRGSKRLAAAGVATERISTKILTGSDTTAAILSYVEQNLFDCLVVARRGVGLMGQYLLGSVSSSLFDKSGAVPLWIIDGNVSSKNFLIPVDGTPPSLLALDHAAYLFKGRTDLNFFLFHADKIFSNNITCRPEDFYDKWGKEWCDANLTGENCLYVGPETILKEAGIPEQNITILPRPTALEESSAIISSAKKHKCGNIIIGRRPESEDKGFLGGVSRRTIKQTDNMAVWVIG